MRPRFPDWIEDDDIDDPNYEHWGHERIEAALRRGETVSGIAEGIVEQEEARNWR